jgi:hypothetical protein
MINAAQRDATDDFEQRIFKREPVMMVWESRKLRRTNADSQVRASGLVDCYRWDNRHPWNWV